MLRGRPIACFTLLLALFYAQLAQADQAARPTPASTRVVLMEPSVSNELVRQALVRAEAELRSAGFEVIRQPHGASSSERGALEAAARAHQAAAAISMSLSDQAAAAEVWVAERLTNKTLIRRIDVADVPAGRRSFTLAIRAVELLRASLIELADPSHSQPAEPLPDAVVRLLAGPPQAPLAGFGLDLGVGALFSVDRLDPALAPLLRVSYGGTQGLALRLSWLPPLMSLSEEGAQGVARIRQQVLMLDGVFAPTLDGSVVVPMASAGVGLYHLAARGELLPPAIGQTEEVWSFALSAGGGALARFNDTFGAALQLQGVMALPRPVVTMAGVPLGSAGQPSLLLSLGGVAHF